jgi:hypothetical protein
MRTLAGDGAGDADEGNGMASGALGSGEAKFAADIVRGGVRSPVGSSTAMVGCSVGVPARGVSSEPVGAASACVVLRSKGFPSTLSSSLSDTVLDETHGSDALSSGGVAAEMGVIGVAGFGVVVADVFVAGAGPNGSTGFTVVVEEGGGVLDMRCDAGGGVAAFDAVALPGSGISAISAALPRREGVRRADAPNLGVVKSRVLAAGSGVELVPRGVGLPIVAMVRDRGVYMVDCERHCRRHARRSERNLRYSLMSNSGTDGYLWRRTCR